MAKKKPGQRTMTFAEYGRHQGNVSYKTVSNWAEAKKIKLVGRGIVDVDVSDEMLADTRGPPDGKEPKKPSGPVDERAPYTSLEAARVKENFNALARKMAYEREAGELCSMDDVVAAVMEQVAIIRTRLLDIGSTVAPMLLHQVDVAQVKTVIDAEVIHALEELVASSNGDVEELLKKKGVA